MGELMPQCLLLRLLPIWKKHFYGGWNRTNTIKEVVAIKMAIRAIKNFIFSLKGVVVGF